MNIQPYKDREINFSKPVRVYRCLNRSGNVYSIKQGAHVVAHTTELTLRNTTFHVGEKGRQRCLKEKQRNVHAWIIGTINDKFVPCDKEIYYNPYKTECFTLKHEKSHIDKSEFVSIWDNSIFIN